jgi:site-specific DNA-methyltransferase (adenine-specific)
MKIKTATLLNVDCMEFMASLPDKAFDLAIVDPPYGIGIASNPVRQMHTKKQWDNATPSEDYFKELKRVSEHQIIWGGNYFIDYLGNTQGFLIWDKVQPHDFSLAMCEMAWTSIQKPAKIWRRPKAREALRMATQQLRQAGR